MFHQHDQSRSQTMWVRPGSSKHLNVKSRIVEHSALSSRAQTPDTIVTPMTAGYFCFAPSGKGAFLSDVCGGKHFRKDGEIGHAPKVVADDPGRVHHHVADLEASMPAPVKAGADLHGTRRTGMSRLSGQCHRAPVIRVGIATQGPEPLGLTLPV